MKKQIKAFYTKVIKNKKLSGYLFKFLLFTSILFLFISSEDKLLSLLDFPFFKWIFINDLPGNSIIFNLSLGYIVSAIFYFIVVYIPERQKIEDLKPHLNKKIESIIYSINGIISDIIRHSEEKIKIRDITEEDLKKMCNSINPKKINVLFHNYSKTYSKHLGYSFSNNWRSIVIHMDETLKYIPFLNTNLILILNEIEDCSLGLTIKTLENIDKISNTNMKAWSDCFYNLLVLGKKLAKYHKENNNENFKNPFI